MLMKILDYSMQLAMLKQLLSKGLITKQEYERVKQKLMNDYGIVSNITS